MNRRDFARLLAIGGAAPFLSPNVAWPRSLDLPPTPASPDEKFWMSVRDQFVMPKELTMLNAANLCPSSGPVLETMYRRAASHTASDAWLEDQFVAAAAALSKVHAEGCKRASKIPAKKPSTRVELYRRLLRGKDYMDSFFGDPLRLAEVANQACLSPYHFHRLFREVFRETPNQYLQRRRLASAQRLLERSEQSVTDICLEVGFESISSFSALFRRTFGCPPREYRFRKNGTRVDCGVPRKRNRRGVP